MVIGIIGGSGSGKDTQAKFLSKELGLPAISTGQMMRDGEKRGDTLAVKAMEMANRGEWVDNETVTKIFINSLKEKKITDGFIVTGYPRFEEQIKSFREIAASIDDEVSFVIHIDVPDEVLTQRMVSRREATIKAGGKPRDDETDEAIANRIKAYHETIDPLLEHYKKVGKLINVDGTPSIEKVREEILQKVNEMLEN